MRKPDSSPRDNPLFVNAVGKSMDVLRAFAGAGRYLSLTDIAARSGLDKSTAQRMTHTLHELGYLEKCVDTRRYALGAPLLDFSYQYLRTHPLVELATPHLIELRRECEERVDMSLFDTSTLVYVVRLQSKREKFYTTLAGRRMPVFCTAGGRAMLACLPEDEARTIVETGERQKLTPHTLTDVDRVMEKIAQARLDGFAVAEQEAIPGEIAIGGAIVDGGGRPIGAVHIAAALHEWRLEPFVAQMLPRLRHTLEVFNQHFLRT